MAENVLAPQARSATIAQSKRWRDRFFSGDIVYLLFLLPSLFLLVLFLGLPLVVVFLNSLQPNVLIQFEGPGFDNYVYLATSQYYFDVIIRTIRLSAVTAALALPVGYLTAYLMRGLSGRAGNFAMMGLTFPILTGPLIVVLGWMALLADGGPLFGPLIQAGLIDRLRILGTETAIVIGLLQFALPFVVLTLYTSLRQIPRNVMEAASSLGASGFQKFVHVILPLSAPGIISGVILAFSLAASAYVAPYYLGGAAQLTLTTLISQFVLATFNSELAAAAAIVLLVIMVSFLFLFIKVTGRLVRT